jgi:D-sedoheptulose 7-phosphate isomerase
LVAGNGGSAAEAQHLAAELVGRLRGERIPLSAIALTADTSALTAISNDYGYEEVFARQVRGHGRAGDILIALSTSGRSPNLLAAVRAARETGLRTWALTGPGPNPLAEAADESLCCPAADSQVVQELHLISVHVLCEHVDHTLPTVLAAGSALPAARRDHDADPADLTSDDLTVDDLTAEGLTAEGLTGEDLALTDLAEAQLVTAGAGPPDGPTAGPSNGSGHVPSHGGAGHLPGGHHNGTGGQPGGHS